MAGDSRRLTDAVADPAPRAHSGRGGGVAPRPGPRALAGLAALLVVACGACGSTAASSAHRNLVAAATAGTQGTRNASHDGLVGEPSWLPKWTEHWKTDAVLTGTAARPALTNQGDAVHVVTPHWSVDATVAGPEVPGEGLPYQAPATTCTWTVTLEHATGPVPISVTDFDSIDDQGYVYQPYLVSGQPAPPKMLMPGQKVSFELRAAEPVGEGLFRWAPIGGRIVAKWDFVVEND